MFRKIILPLIAVAGLSFAVFMIYYGSRKTPVAPILFKPPTSPYQHFVAGAGIIEAATENINIGATFPDFVTDVYVVVGERVKKGAQLFKLDTRFFEAQLLEAQREQDFAQKALEDECVQFSFYKRLKDKSAASEKDYQNANYNMQLAQERLGVAKAKANEYRVQIERSMARAPVDGQVLQINVRVGQFANVNPFDQKPLILFGDTNTLHVRVDIDEQDAWRVKKQAPGIAFVRGNVRIQIPLEFVKIEPYVVPKTSLTGDNTERFDTRVLQVIYSFHREKYPVYVGQRLDVFLEAEPQEVDQ